MVPGSTVHVLENDVPFPDRHASTTEKNLPYAACLLRGHHCPLLSHPFTLTFFPSLARAFWKKGRRGRKPSGEGSYTHHRLRPDVCFLLNLLPPRARHGRSAEEARRKGKVDRQHVRMRKIMKEISCRSIPFTHLPPLPVLLARAPLCEGERCPARGVDEEENETLSDEEKTDP